jgi:hypothetical protein
VQLYPHFARNTPEKPCFYFVGLPQLLGLIWGSFHRTFPIYKVHPFLSQSSMEKS